jgi:hypothetical protein
MTGRDWTKAGRANKEQRARQAPVYGPGVPLGSLEYCWCGMPKNHAWLGQDKGASHPKEEG